MHNECSQNTGRTFRAFATCGASALASYRRSTSSPAGSPVRTSRSPDAVWASPASARAYGASLGESFASFDPATCSWRTLQHSFIEDLTLYSATWPRSGTMRNGTVYRLPPLVPRISGTGSSSWPTPNATDGSKAPKYFARGNPSLPQAVKLWPTPRSHEAGDWQRDNKGRKLKRITLTGAAKMYPTPTVSDATGGPAYSRPPSREGSPTLKESTPGALNPTWVEWLMGFPLGWTDLADSATP